MKIKLERLPHQLAAIKAINESFEGVNESTNNSDKKSIYANPILKHAGNDEANIDIKMETGTGKTFVYTQMMYEFHKQGIFKFVIVVPTPSIKEGTKNFITSDYARQYFSGIPGYENVSMQLHMINAGDFSGRKGRKYFPAELSNFLNETCQNPNQIQVLLINSGMLTSKSMTNSDYEQTLFGGESQPMKAIAATRPVVIIDEPHRFKRDSKAYQAVEKMKPQLIVRFGATFPKIVEGRGRNKVEKTDYYRGEPQYNLNAVDSFNQGLVKGIDIYYPDIPKVEATNLYTVKKVVSKELTLSHDGKDYIIQKGENLADIDEGFAGDITYAGGKELSNGLELYKGIKLIPGIFAQSYQDQLIDQAIDKHFEAEINNFMRKGAPKVKTLSLFFIDSIASFRGSNHSKGWLANHFEQKLADKLNKLIFKYKKPKDDREKEYCDFLIATLKDLKADHQNVYAGYFSEDRGSGEEAIQAEVDDILKNKERLLSFKDKNGDWITRRFLFSKWTLREGWDNPNVFVITKLRRSGSEISKIQEVGRGLRLPVDEEGNRLQQDEFESRLSFIIGYDEQDFAAQLVEEVNVDAPIKVDETKLTDEVIKLVVNDQQKVDKQFDENKLLEILDSYGVIDRSNNFKDNVEFEGQEMSGYQAFVKLYPVVEHQTKVADDRIRDKNSKAKTKVKLRKSNWKQLEELWKYLSQRQMIKFDDKVNGLAETVAKDVFDDIDNKIFVFDQPQVKKDVLDIQDNQLMIKDTDFDLNNEYRIMKYGQFLKQLTLKTDLPVDFLHQQMIETMKRLGGDRRYINEKTLSNLINTFNTHFNTRIKKNYSYESLDFTASTSIYDAEKGQFVDSISVNDLGVYSDNSVTDDSTYLYDRPPLRYDSADPELKILKRTYGDDITVFGKLPKRAIKIPRYDNGTTTPDFIFKINRPEKPIYVVIETKPEGIGKRIKDEITHIIQEKYFDNLKNEGVYYQLATSAQEVNDLIKEKAGEFD